LILQLQPQIEQLSGLVAQVGERLGQATAQQREHGEQLAERIQHGADEVAILRATIDKRISEVVEAAKSVRIRRGILRRDTSPYQHFFSLTGRTCDA